MNEALLQINMFSCGHRAHRLPFSMQMVNEIFGCRNRHRIRLCIHAEAPVIEKWKQLFGANPLGCPTFLIQYPDSNYMNRVQTAQNTDCKYSCKMDDDVLISRHVWDYMVDNLGVLTPKHPIMAPILTNGMPTVEMFVRDFLNEDDQKKAYHLFLTTGKIPESLWGLDYSAVNEKLRSMKEWNPHEYWNFMMKVDTKWETKPVPWYYSIVRGVHPARFSAEYNLFIANCVFKNKEKFFAKQDYSFETFPTPYFTNNIFISETAYWKQTSSLFFDGWDEGQLTYQSRIDDSSILYVKNGFGIHMAYGMTDQMDLIEKTYMENL